MAFSNRSPRARPARTTSVLALVAAALATIGSAAARAESSTCQARSGARPATVVELYTSEGCSSCPPADRWLSQLKRDPQVVALAFHVDYWDRLGWKDRFSSPAFTRRQADQQASNGARFSYTPQVVVDGRDRKDWSGIAAPLATSDRAAMPIASIALDLTRSGTTVHATVAAGTSAPPRLGAYWAVTESEHTSAVQAGENAGARLAHDFVVRAYQPVAPWAVRRDGATALSFEVPPAEDAARPRRVSLVVVDAASGRPLQALSLGC